MQQLLRVAVRLELDLGVAGKVPGLGNLVAAIAAWRAGREGDETNQSAMDELARLYEAAGERENQVEILREKEMVRLGQQTLAEGALSEEAMEDGLDCLARYAALARAAGADSITAVATCAVREASNGGELVRRVRRETGLRLAVISGEEEARLITRAVRADLPPSCDPLLVLDIGGGSTEVVVATGEKILIAESLDLGAVRLTDLHVSSDPLSPKGERALRKTIRSRLERLEKPVQRAKIKTAVGTSGSLRVNTSGPPEPAAIWAVNCGHLRSRSNWTPRALRNWKSG